MGTTERSRYSSVAIWLHWIIAVVIIGNLVGGLTRDIFLDSSDPAMQQIGQTVMGLHKSLGLTVILLTLLRIGWRLANPPPPLPAHMTRGELLAARLTHIGFYALMLLLPFSGWAMVSTGKRQVPISWFGLFDVPLLPLSPGWRGLFNESHELLGFATIALLALHILAALKHRIFDRDDVMARMLPQRRNHKS